MAALAFPAAARPARVALVPRRTAGVDTRGGEALLGNIAVGIVGAVIGGFLFGGVFVVGGVIGQIISATLGAVILLFVISLVKR